MNILLLLSGCLVFLLTVTYAWWSNVRVMLLQLELFSIHDDYFRNRDILGAVGSEDPAEFSDAMRQLISGAPLLTSALIGRFSRLPDATLAGLLGPDAEPFFELLLDPRPKSPALKLACFQVCVRVGRYLALETFSGWVTIVREIFAGPTQLFSLPSSPSEVQDSREVLITAAKFLSRGEYRQTA